MKKCKNCGEIASLDTQYCNNCGGNEFIVGKDVVCPNCGYVNDQSYTHCTNCGTAVIDAQDRLVAVDNSTAIDIRAELNTDYNAKAVVSPVRESSKCPNCGTEVQINSIFCYKCGTPVTRLHENKMVSRKMCTHCNTPNLLTSTYCSYCYASLEDAPIEDYQLTYETKTLGKSVIKRAILQGASARYHMCNSCGAINKHDDEFCVQCGLKLVLEENLRYCVNCGAENDGNALFCDKCQWSFEGTSPEKEQAVWTCAHCNNVNSDDDKYCIKCGKPYAGKSL